MKPCCQTTAQKQLKKTREVAICDGCGHLIMTYDNDRDYDEAKKALTQQGTPFEDGSLGPLRLLSKPRRSVPRG